MLALVYDDAPPRDTCFLLSLTPPVACEFDLRVAQPAHGHPSSRPILRVRCLYSPHLSLSILRPLTAERLPGFFLKPQRRRWSLVACSRAPRVVPDRANGTHERGWMLVVLARH